jgi:hypothetical protein
MAVTLYNPSVTPPTDECCTSITVANQSFGGLKFSPEDTMIKRNCGKAQTLLSFRTGGKDPPISITET